MNRYYPHKIPKRKLYPPKENPTKEEKYKDFNTDWEATPIKGVNPPYKLYFILCKQSDAVKIGITTRDVKIRLKELQTGNPFPLYIYHTIEVKRGFNLENHFHVGFKHLRLKGEWFKFSGEIKEHIYWNFQKLTKEDKAKLKTETLKKIRMRSKKPRRIPAGIPVRGDDPRLCRKE